MIFERVPNMSKHTDTHTHSGRKREREKRFCFSSDLFIHFISSSFLSQSIKLKNFKGYWCWYTMYTIQCTEYIFMCYSSFARSYARECVCACACFCINISPFVFRFRHLRAAKLSKRNHCLFFFSSPLFSSRCVFVEQCVGNAMQKNAKNTHTQSHF